MSKASAVATRDGGRFNPSLWIGQNTCYVWRSSCGGMMVYDGPATNACPDGCHFPGAQDVWATFIHHDEHEKFFESMSLQLFHVPEHFSESTQILKVGPKILSTPMSARQETHVYCRLVPLLIVCTVVVASMKFGLRTRERTRQTGSFVPGRIGATSVWLAPPPVRGH